MADAPPTGAANLDVAIGFITANKQIDQTNERGAHGDSDVKAKDAGASLELYNKLKPKDIKINADLQLGQEERIGGAYYLPLKQKASATWVEVCKALESLPDCDVNLEQELINQWEAYGLQYYHDTYALARTRLCKLENTDGTFLEINRMQGDGFVFADTFKKNLVEKLTDFVEDVDTAAPVPSENSKEPSLNYLDLSNEHVGTDMIQHWLQTLKPKGGVKYDQRQLYETISSLGWNVQEPENFKALSDYSDYIVSPILQVLRHSESNHVPTAYFGAMCIKKFVEEDAVPEEAKTWESVFFLVEAMEKFCVTEKFVQDATGAGGIQVTKSRQLLQLLISILEKFVPMVTGDKIPQLANTVNDMLKKLTDLQPEAIDSLRKTLGVEEEVNAA